MISKLEILPNETLLNVFFYLSWDEILISFWSLNKRINSLICSMFSISNKKGIILNKPGLSYKKFSKTLSLILNASSLLSSIKSIHFDGINSFSFDSIYENIFYHDNKPIVCFPNLKSLYISQCLLSQPLIQLLCFLIQLKLEHLTLTFHEGNYTTSDYRKEAPSNSSDQGNQQFI
ncbi:unnamed protein product [Rotaria sp. Silwood1]|nr:unnamed protein product [Rotaria sp. Silwood1]CAF1580182.1 unnamed protein product [Rotaria sp. Silwood1]CAF3724020.1 unnamed protein product [Rotaria sp. Silwood1]CAF5003302.1 unnamed protein product [Rotaria sp. Silwood1]